VESACQFECTQYTRSVRVSLQNFVYIFTAPWGGMGWIHLVQANGSCEHGNEQSGTIKRLEILQQLCDWQLLKNASAS
jgi:hypothetical protein